MSLDLNNTLNSTIGGSSKKAIKAISGAIASPEALSQQQKALGDSRSDPFKYSFLIKDKRDKEPDAEVDHLKSLRLIGEYVRGAQDQTQGTRTVNPKLASELIAARQDQRQAFGSKPKSKLDELKELLKQHGFTDKEIDLLEPLLENEDFQRLIRNNPDQAREMLESIKSDPFSTNNGKVNFEKDNYEIFTALDRTGIDSVLEAGLGGSLHDSLESFANQNDFNSQLYENFLDQALANPEIQKILEDESLNDREKLQAVIQGASEFVKEGMEQLGAIEVGGKLVSPDDGRLLIFGDADARSKFYEEGGAYDQAMKQDPSLKIAFMELGDANDALAKTLGIDVDNISSGDFSGALITQKGYDPSAPGEFKVSNNNLQEVLEQYSEDKGSGESLSSDLTKDYDALKSGEVKKLDITSSDSKDNDKVADLYAKMVLKQILEGEDVALGDGLELGSGSLAEVATGVEKKFNTAEKSGLKLNANDASQVLGKFSGLDDSQISKLQSDLGGNFDARTLGVLLQAGKTDSSDLSANDRHVIGLFDKYQGIAGRNTKELYEADMKDLHEKGVLVDYLYDKMPGTDMTYKEAAESIMNIPKDSRGFFDGATGLNAIGSVNTIAQILRDPEKAFKDGEGFYARLTIADAKDHNGAFGLNSGNHYVRGNEEAAMSLLSGGKIGNVTIYGGNGMSDDEFEKRIKRLMMTGTKLDGQNGELVAVADSSTVRGLGLKHVSEEGHGNTSGNHGVAGSMDSSDSHRFATYASLVKGDSFSLNCVACSNMGGNNSYGHVVLNQMAKHLGKNVRLYATGAEIPTPPKNDRITHFKGHIAPGLMTNSDRLIVMQGQQEVSSADMIELSNAYRDEYNITRVNGDLDVDLAADPAQRQNIYLGDAEENKFVSTEKKTDESLASDSEWLKATNSRTA